MTRDEERNFKLSREVRIGELVATLGVISAIATTYIELRLRPLDTQFKSIEKQIATIEAQAARMEAANVLTKREVREDLQRIDSKIDRLLEQRQGGR